MNVENILAVADVIERDAVADVSFNMGSWFTQGSCGTTACIAGYACLLFGGGIPKWRKRMETGFVSVDTVAEVFLGLGPSEFEALAFYGPTWRKLNHVTREEAVNVLRHLAKTGVVDWDKANPWTDPRNVRQRERRLIKKLLVKAKVQVAAFRALQPAE